MPIDYGPGDEPHGWRNRDLDHIRDLKAVIQRLEAALASRPPASAWTSEPPKVPGWYWVKGSTGKCTSVLHVHAFEIEQPWHGDCRWAGPIPEPPESTREEQP